MSRDRVLKKHLRDRFVVTLKTGETFDGLLDEWDGLIFGFVDSYAVSEKSRVQVDGTLFVPRDQVAYMQRPPS